MIASNWSAQAQDVENTGSHLLFNLDLLWDLELQRNLKSLSWQQLPPMQIDFNLHAYGNQEIQVLSLKLFHQFLHLVSETMNLYTLHLFILPFVIYSCYLRATAWLTVLNCKHEATCGICYWYWCKGVKPTEHILFHRYKHFFQLMIVCGHCNDRMICSLFY